MNQIKRKVAGALYYPYIHIDDVDWLLSNLIIFPCIKRMIPMNFTTRDSYRVKALAEEYDGRQALLRPANLFSATVIQAQANLAAKLKRDGHDHQFLSRYGKQAARSFIDSNAYGFQIHAQKLSEELKDALFDTQLAWNPDNTEPYDKYSEYVEVHPRVGEAVMSTLAIPCAQDDGLDIVADKRSGDLRRCLLEKELDAVYDSWLRLDTYIEPPLEASGEDLMEFVIGMAGDLSTLSVDAIRELSFERQPIDDLLAAMRQEAATIPMMKESAEREEFFKQAATKIMQKWEGDRNNLSNFGRNFFGKDTATIATRFATAVGEKTFTGLATGTIGALGTATLTGSITGNAANAGWVGALATGGVIGAGAGLIIGLLAHAGTTYHHQAKREVNSPYRFLTTLEEKGVFCRF